MEPSLLIRRRVEQQKESSTMGTNDRLRVLQIEDSRSDAALVVRALEKAGFDVECRRIEEAAELTAALVEQNWDLILADYNLPGFGAPAALELVRGSGFDIPFIVISGSMGEDRAVELMKAGANDFIMKSHLARLGPAVRREIREARTRVDRRRAAAQLHSLEERLETQRSAFERQAQSLREKETLLREIHHRINNNLQVVSSILNLQSRAASSTDVHKALLGVGTRIHAMALLHETLYSSENPALVDFSAYVQRLAEQLFQAHGNSGNGVRLNTALKPLCLDIDVALPCALIINEVVSNSLQHAFPDGRRGEIRIVLEEKTGVVSLLLADNGIGLPAGQEPDPSLSLGYRLIKTLSRQLNASLDFSGQNGVQCRLTFSAEHSSENVSEVTGQLAIR